MSEDSDGHEAPTRRDYMKYGGAVVGGGLLAGCAGQSDSGDTPEATDEETDTDSDSTETTADASYSATMPPVGTVEFDEPPESVIPALQFGVDTMLALGQIDRVEMMSWKGTLTAQILNMVPGVSIDPDSIEDLGSHGKGKEVFYEADPDLFAQDPNIDITFSDNLEAEDIEEIS